MPSAVSGRVQVKVNRNGMELSDRHKYRSAGTGLRAVEAAPDPDRFGLGCEAQDQGRPTPPARVTPKPSA